jgi:hypothetical protein
MPFNFSEGLTYVSDQLNIENGSFNLENEFLLAEESVREGELSITNPLDFKKITIAYMNEEAKKYGYPDIFAAMSLKNSSIPELAAEGASWTEFFDAGMTFIDYEIKTENYLTFDKSTVSIRNESLSPKVTFTPSLTYPSLAE